MCSSILSITNIAMMDVKAIVIYSKNKAYTSERERERERQRETQKRKEPYRKAIPDEASIIRVEMVVRRSESNSSHTDEKASPSQLLTSQTVFHTQKDSIFEIRFVH